METITLTADLPASAPSSIRSRRADEAILPADVWCPIYCYFTGTPASPKFNDQQIETIAYQGTEQGWCNLCDAPLVGNRDEHVKAHMAQLRKWRRERGAAIDRDRAARAREARKAKAVA